MEQKKDNFTPQYAVTWEEQERKTHHEEPKPEPTKKKGFSLSSLICGIFCLALSAKLIPWAYSNYQEANATYENASAIIENSTVVKTDSAVYGDATYEVVYHKDSSDDDGADDSYQELIVKQDIVFTYTVDGQSYEKAFDDVTVYDGRSQYFNPTEEQAFAQAETDGEMNCTYSWKLYVDNEDPSISYVKSNLDVQTYDNGDGDIVFILIGVVAVIFGLILTIGAF